MQMQVNFILPETINKGLSFRRIQWFPLGRFVLKTWSAGQSLFRGQFSAGNPSRHTNLSRKDKPPSAYDTWGFGG